MSCIVLSIQAFTALAKEAITCTQQGEVWLLVCNQITTLVSLSLVVLGSAARTMKGGGLMSLETIVILILQMA